MKKDSPALFTCMTAAGALSVGHNLARCAHSAHPPSFLFRGNGVRARLGAPRVRHRHRRGGARCMYGRPPGAQPVRRAAVARVRGYRRVVAGAPRWRSATAFWPSPWWMRSLDWRFSASGCSTAKRACCRSPRGSRSSPPPAPAALGARCGRRSGAHASSGANVLAFLCACAMRCCFWPRSIYILTALARSRGEWARFWMGDRAPRPAAKQPYDTDARAAAITHKEE